MSEEQKKRFIIFLTDLECTIKDFKEFLGDFLCKIRNLKQNVKFLQCNYELVINIEREEID